MKNFIIATIIIISTGCTSIKDAAKPVKETPLTQGDPQDAVPYGYQPIDPLPVLLLSETVEKGGDTKLNKINSVATVTNKRIMASLPDETMRLAIGQIDLKGNISFTTAKLGYAGSSYIVILDYIKFDTKSLPVAVHKDTAGNVMDFKPALNLTSEMTPDATIPVYVGVGLRFTATIKVNEGTVDLGNLFAVGLAAESKQVTGTLVIQTLGVSGKDISALIPMPSQINTTTIQNAIMSLAAIKAKVYEDSSDLNPRVVGFYNNIGGGKNTAQTFISRVLSMEMNHIIK